jgi:hypothetical protein
MKYLDFTNGFFANIAIQNIILFQLYLTIYSNYQGFKYVLKALDDNFGDAQKNKSFLILNHS